MSAHDAEQAIITEAQAILGETDQVVAAGYFGLTSLKGAHIAGGTAGALVGSLVDDPLGEALGTAIGGRAAVNASAEAQGVTVRLIVAVSAEKIHVLNQETQGRLAAELATFPRSTAEVSVQKKGLSRIVTIADPATDSVIELHGSVSPLSAQSVGDKVVLALLA